MLRLLFLIRVSPHLDLLTQTRERQFVDLRLMHAAQVTHAGVDSPAGIVVLLA
jgi:hypothetical protein